MSRLADSKNTVRGNPKGYPHPRLQDFPRWKKTPERHWIAKSSLAAGIRGWGQVSGCWEPSHEDVALGLAAVVHLVRVLFVWSCTFRLLVVVFVCLSMYVRIHIYI